MFKKCAIIFLALVMTFPATFVAQAASLSATLPNGTTVTLYGPDSFESCTPVSRVYTTGISPDQNVRIWFFQYNPAINNMDWIGGSPIYTTGNLDASFPYPATISGTMQFAVRVDVMAANNVDYITKLELTWKVTCNGGGGYGCTPGYWRNHLSSWSLTPYRPTDDFNTTFGVNYFPGMTLQTAVNLGGGGLDKVARHGTAALLSASYPGLGYPYTVAQVIAYVQAGNVDLLAAANEMNCPLN